MTSAISDTEAPPTPQLKHEPLYSRFFWNSSKGHPFTSVEWVKRSVKITDDTGRAVFQQEDVEAPATWSDMAVKVVASKYFYGERGTPERETSVKQLIERVCTTIADWGLKDGYFASSSEAEDFCCDLMWACVNQLGVFNSPVWFNVGLYAKYGVGKNSQEGNWVWNDVKGEAERAKTQHEHPQASACFIQSVDDNMESIMQLALSEAMLFKFGSGTGTDLSTLRSSREKLSGGGTPSGPLSFLKVYDQVASVVKSGGKTRRAAKMNTLCDWHGDIEEFIEAKSMEEKKAWALIDQGYEGNFNGEAYGSVMYQNENLSVRVSDEFMKAVSTGEDWWTRSVTTGKPLEKKNAKTLLRKMAEGTWLCGDPGIQFDSTIQRWHTCKGTGPIHSTNPCSEYVFLDNTACNLASLNLVKFENDDRTFNTESFSQACRLFIVAQEILVDRASYPTKMIAENSHIFRTLGLGYANLGALIMGYGLPYDSDEARGLASSITSLMTSVAYEQSGMLAAKKGAFDGYKNSRCAGVKVTVKESNAESMLEVIDNHSRQSKQLKVSEKFNHIKLAADKAWTSALYYGVESGFRNAQVTVIAPTGTISFMMDCDTTGIEPEIALVKYKTLAGGGTLKIVNQTVDKALVRLGYLKSERDVILQHIEETGTIEKARKFDTDNLPVFDCAFKAERGVRSIPFMAHLKMMAAVQPFVSGAISKTVNLPSTCTVEDIFQAYFEAWKMGLKCVAMYRDGSKRSQPLNTGKKADVVGSPETEKLFKQVEELKLKLAAGVPSRKRLPDTRPAVTHKFSVSGHEGYLTVGMFENGTPGELFIQMAKEGSTIGGLMDTIGTLTSIALQYGVAVDMLANKFSHQRFEPSGFTHNKDIKSASSIIDYVFRWMELEFVKKIEVHAGNGHVKPEVKPDAENRIQNEQDRVLASFQQDAPVCSNCGHVTVRSGSCHKCLNCGESMGCS